MKNSLTIIKTLSHLIPLFIPQDKVSIYSKIYSDEVIKIFSDIRFVPSEKIKFSSLIAKVLEIKSEYIDKAYLEKYKENVNQYSKVEQVEKMLDFSVKGDVMAIWPLGYQNPIRIEFFGEDCEKIYLYDYLTNRRLHDLNGIVLSDTLPIDPGVIEEIIINIPKGNELTIPEKIIFSNKTVKGIETFYEDINWNIIQTDFNFLPLYFSNMQLVEKEIQRLKDQGYEVLISTKHKNELPKELRIMNYELRIENEVKGYKLYPYGHKQVTNENEKSEIRKSKNQEIENISYPISHIPHLQHSPINFNLFPSLPAGFISQELKFALFTDRELFGSIYLNKLKGKNVASGRLKKLLALFEGEIQIGDYVVHEDYGIGQYSGMKQEKVDDVSSDYLLVKYADNDELYVPLTQIEKITKYLGNSDLPPKLTKLSHGNWKKLREKIRKTTYLLARELLEHLAKREASKAKAISTTCSKDYDTFVNEFKYVETRDQAIAINEILKDLESEKPMNRLLVGDVGFGKTEVIMRAAFKIMETGGQVAVLAPTTVLTAQHYQVFKERFKSFPFKIGFVSRFNSQKENMKIVDDVNNGSVDLVIGTHRLISSDVKFKNLQLLVIDEEQKFGVKQKEKFKKINYTAHLLSVSATPIPRTLSLALSSIQDISIITTPPLGRNPIDTEIIFDDWNKVVNVIQAEIERDGQVYFLHNKVASINAIKTKLEKLMPGVRFEIAHGQMSPMDLDKVMANFYYHKFDVLICSTIIENGLDIQNVNTIIVNDAHRFGLSQLYQLRGRVGRSDKKAFCYLLAPRPKKSHVISLTRPLATLSLRRGAGGEANDASRPKLYMERLNSLIENNQLGAGFQIASKDLEIRGAGTILGEKQHGHIAEIGYALYIQMLTEEIERIKGEKN